MPSRAPTPALRRALGRAAIVATVLLAGEWGYRAALALPWRCGGAGAADGFDVYGVGESTALGEPYEGSAALPRLVEKAFGGRFQGRSIRARVLARRGESIYPQAWAFERALLCRPRGRPGAVLIYSGHNDAAYADETPFAEYVREEVLERSRLLRDFFYMLEKAVPALRVRTLHTYEHNLRRVVEQSLRAGLTPVLTAVASDMTGVDPGLDVSAAPVPAAEIARGERLEAQGRARAALELYRRLSDERPALRGYLRYARARCLLRLGQRAKARALFRACLEQRAPDFFGRATREQNEIVRRLAREYDVPLVDAEPILSAGAPAGLPGGAWFSDGHHPSLRGYAVLGDAYARALARAYGEPAPPALARAPALAGVLGIDRGQELEARLHSASWMFSAARVHAYPELRARLAEERFRAALELEPEGWPALLGLALTRALRRDAQAGADRSWLDRYGVGFGARDALDDERWSGLAAELGRRGETTRSLDRLARARVRASRDRRAEDAIRQARGPASSEARRAALDRAAGLAARPEQEYEIAQGYQDLGDYPRALDILRRLTAREPGRAEYLASRGLCEYLSGSAERAQATLRAAIRADGGYLPAYLTLEAIYAEQKRRREAVALYETALDRTRDRPADELRRRIEADLAAMKDGAAP